jgi:hypothetical protein
MSADFLPDDRWTLLRAVIDRIMPVDEHPSATGFGAEAYIADRFTDDPKSRNSIGNGLAAVDAQAYARFDHSFLTLSAGATTGASREITIERRTLAALIREARKLVVTT